MLFDFLSVFAYVYYVNRFDDSDINKKTIKPAISNLVQIVIFGLLPMVTYLVLYSLRLNGYIYESLSLKELEDGSIKGFIQINTMYIIVLMMVYLAYLYSILSVNKDKKKIISFGAISLFGILFVSADYLLNYFNLMTISIFGLRYECLTLYNWIWIAMVALATIAIYLYIFFFIKVIRGKNNDEVNI